MKKLVLLSFLLISGLFSFAPNAVIIPPLFIIEGELKNLDAKQKR